MKFMVNWRVHPDKRVRVITLWSGLRAKQRADVGPGLRLIGRWHNFGEYTGVAVVEANDAATLLVYLGKWNPVMDLDVSPVLDDEESAATGKAIVANMASG